MALQKTAASVEQDKFSEFDFALLRMHEASLAGRPVVDQYSFRVNETSRFIVETGMHYSFGPVVVTLQDLSSNSFTFIGEQSYNLNRLDRIVPAGDYSVVIE